MAPTSTTACSTPEIIANLESPTTTDAHTYEQLRVLLGFDVQEPPIKQTTKAQVAADTKPVRNHNTKDTTTRITKSAKTTKTSSKPPFEIYESDDRRDKVLDPSARRKVATEAFNAALKSLSTAVKTRQDNASVVEACKTPAPKQKSRKLPLQTSSPNKQAKPDATGCLRLPDSRDVSLAADCASVALDCLRQLNNSEEQDGTGGEKLQKGGLILLEKLISLRLATQAEQEATAQYGQYWKRRTCGPTNVTRGIPIAFVTKETSKADLEYISSFQSQILRLAILQGRVAVTESFVTSMEMTITGGPADIVMKGLQSKCLDKEKAGQQLRTIAQALLKLYSISTSDKHGSKDNPQLNFRLLLHALIIKSHSWKLLQHKPDLDREFWSFIVKGIRRLGNEAQQLDTDSIAGLIELVQRARETLEELNFDARVPGEIAHALVDLTEKRYELEEITKLFRELGKYSDYWESEQKMTWVWRATITQCKDNGMRDLSLVKRFEAVSASFIDTCQLPHIDRTLIYGARLRKTVISIVRGLAASAKHGDISTTETKVFDACFEILEGFSALLLRSIQSQHQPDHVDMTKLAFTSFAKTFEALIDAYNLGPESSSALWELYRSSVHKCVQSVKTLLLALEPDFKDNEVFVFTESLMVKASNILWVRYANLENDGRGQASSKAELSLLEQSCTIVADASPNVQRLASYGMKLEKLAVAHLRAKEVPAAVESFEKSILHYTAIGAVSEATKAASSGPSFAVWTRKGSSSYALSRTIQSLVKICLTYGHTTASTGTWVYDDQRATFTARILLFDLQLTASATHEFNQEQIQTLEGHIHTLLSLCDDPGSDVHCLRLVSRLLRTMSKNDSLAGSVLLASNIVKNVIHKLPQPRSKSSISPCLISLRSLVRIQWLMQVDKLDKLDINELNRQCTALSNIILSSTDIESLHASIDDLNIVLNQLQAVLGFCRLIDNIDMMISCLDTLKHILNLTGASPTARIVELDVQLGTLHHRLGKKAQAEEAFVAAEQLFNSSSVDPRVYMKWACAYASFLADNSTITNAMEVYSRAVASLSKSENDDQNTGRERVEKQSLICTSAYVASVIASQSGSQHLAGQFARQAVKLSTSIWQALEKSSSSDPPLMTAGNDSMLHNVTAEMSNLSISVDKPAAESKAKGSLYWAHIDLHCLTLVQMINVSVHNGLFHDAVFYAEQFRNVARAAASEARISRATALLAFVHAKAGHDEESRNLLLDRDDIPSRLVCLEDRIFAITKAETYLEINEEDAALTILDALQAATVDTAEPVVVSEIVKNGIKKTPVRGKAKVIHPIKGPPKRPGRQAAPKMAVSKQRLHVATITRSEQIILEKCRTLRARIGLTKHGAAELSEQALDSVDQPCVMADTCISKATVILQKALTELSSDAVKCVLAETAVALPVRYKSSRKSGRVSFVQMAETSLMMRTPKTPRSKVVPGKSSLAVSKQLSAGERLVLDARKLLREAQFSMEQSSSTDMLHTAHKLQSKIALLTSTMDVPLETSSAELALQSLISKDVVQKREWSSVQAERRTRDKVEMLTWPDISELHMQRSVHDDAGCTMDALADIPESWSIITISLADNQQELLMSRIVNGRSPFLLRIPLSRSDLEVDEDNEFTFAEAKTEILDIVDKANSSAHDARGQGGREARKAWYAEREDLDSRLESWLINVENIWLGGFRGLMSSRVYDDDLLAKFGQALDQVLTKHLPSRQKSAVPVKSKIALHAHVLELFLGLGDPDEDEMDDAATDLLYFVVDILQFGGERNAYDEIDFDSMLVDVFDALRACCSRVARTDASNSRHTILIVDKEMASFPWESLPCLRSRSVSRMPSLSSILQRVKQIREQSDTAQGFTILANQGAYILNPSSDLAATQATFQPVLESQLSTYAASTNKKPTESDFTSLLSNSQLLLYFGHGSGAQYIRGRTIRNLDACAVTLLMGCSSAKMTECGKFESYGMPGYYIGGMSGCMSVVGTLWDVTDRDIDRFALKTMLEWGLIEEDEHVRKALERSSKKMKNAKGGSRDEATKDTEASVSMAERRGVVNLDQAVSRGRDACLLRYLNGAAPVVYGIPVFLR